MDTINTLMVHLENLITFLNKENCCLKENKLKDVLKNKDQKAQLWALYQHHFEAAFAKGVFNHNTKQHVIMTIQKLTQSAEENQHLIDDVMQSYDRIVKRFAQKSVGHKSVACQAYNRRGGLNTNDLSKTTIQSVALTLNQRS